MLIDKNKCINDFLRYRTILDNQAWATDIVPHKCRYENEGTVPVKTAQDLEASFKQTFSKITPNQRLGIMLSGGIDSAILASYMPAGSVAYTMRCVAENSVNEVERAKKYAEKCNLELKIVDITWDDMNRISKTLMMHSKMPHHSIQPMIYRIAEEAKKDGIKTVLCGESADCKYGGFDGLLSKTWTVDEFIERYTFLNPDLVLKNPVANLSEIEKVQTGNTVDVHKFLNTHFVPMALHDYLLPFKLNDVDLIMPFAFTYLDAPLDLGRIRTGDSKYIVRELYVQKYPDIEPEKKLPMPRAVGVWLKDFKLSGQFNDVFRQDIDFANLKPDQKWQLYILQMFLDMMDKGEL